METSKFTDGINIIIDKDQEEVCFSSDSEDNNKIWELSPTSPIISTTTVLLKTVNIINFNVVE